MGSAEEFKDLHGPGPEKDLFHWTHSGPVL